MTEKPMENEHPSPQFSIEAVRKSLEKGVDYPLQEFIYDGNTYFLRVTLFQDEASRPNIFGVVEERKADQALSPESKKYFTEIHVFDESQNKLGRVYGVVIYSGGGFVNFQATNEGYESQGQEVPYIRGLVRESICQLVLRGVFRVWYSSMNLDEGGKKMYEEISKRGDVSAQETTSYDGNVRWEVTRIQENTV